MAKELISQKIITLSNWGIMQEGEQHCYVSSFSEAKNTFDFAMETLLARESVDCSVSTLTLSKPKLFISDYEEGEFCRGYAISTKFLLQKWNEKESQS